VGRAEGTWDSYLTYRSRLLLALCLAPALALLTLTVPTQAAELIPTGFSRADPFPSPGAFVIHGSHGYVIGVIANPASKEGQDRALVAIVNSSGNAIYNAPANLNGGGIRANLGTLGKINVRWHPNGLVRKLAIRCRGYRSHLYVAEGTYEGKVRIVGEDGFTKATATRIRGRTGWYRLNGCGGTTSEGFPGPGILLEASIFKSRLPKDSYRYVSVVQNRPHGQVSYLAALGEHRGRLSIDRTAYALGRARTLTFDSHLDTGSISPPAPFSGTGMFERLAKHRPGRWRGDLVVDFPGQPDVPLAGKDFGATFMHGFRESTDNRLILQGAWPGR
jgi:hypothetical protein